MGLRSGRVLVRIDLAAVLVAIGVGSGLVAVPDVTLRQDRRLRSTPSADAG